MNKNQKQADYISEFLIWRAAYPYSKVGKIRKDTKKPTQKKLKFAFEKGKQWWGKIDLDKIFQTGPYGCVNPWNPNQTERDQFISGIVLVLAWARGADYYHRYYGSRKENPYVKPSQKTKLEPRYIPTDFFYEWDWWEAGYDFVYGHDEFCCNKEAKDACYGKRRKNLRYTQKDMTKEEWESLKKEWPERLKW